MLHVVRSIKRPSQKTLNAIRQFTPATLHEAQGRRLAMDSRIKPIYPGLSFCGSAITARCTPGDNLMLQAAISIAQPGDVLVVESGNNTEQGPFGEVLATACVARGVAALVIDCAVRDGPAVRDLGLPVFSTGLCIKGTVKETLGDVNHSVVVGGVAISPGDIICGDDDGVVVVRPDDADEVARKSQEREEKEAAFMERLRAGEDVLEVLGMGSVLKNKGCIWE